MAIPLLIGPTACGKSRLAISIAQRLNGELISVDAGAIYQHLDIGTATPTATMLATVRHHLISILPPNDRYSAGQFYQDAAQAVADIRQRGQLPIFVGGTMMYANVLINGLADIPPPPPAIIAAVNAELKAHGVKALHAELENIDAAAAAKIMPTDSVRIIRALAVYRAAGEPLSVRRKRRLPRITVAPILLIPANRKQLWDNIERRLEAMWTAGLEAETRYLLEEEQLPPEAAALRLVGYRQAAAKLRGEMSALAMRQQALIATRQFAKRQLTWLRRWQGQYPVVEPFAADAEEKIIAFVKRGDNHV